MKTIDSVVTLQEVVQFPVLTLINTDDNTFWWTNNKFEKRFKHENAKVGQTFVDGNNGDKWKILASDADHKRLIVQNLGQDWLSPNIVIWD